MQKLRWGILSTAKIGREWLIPAIHASEFAEVTAVASRNGDQARLFAQQTNITKAHDSYEALLADPDIDAIYNPLPNHLHVPYSVKAIEAGKHVLCEKPLGLNRADLLPLLEAAQAHPELVVMEAFMYRFHPQWLKVKQLIDAGELGEITAVDASFSYFNRDAQNVRNQQGIGGGGLMDIGCYCISAARFIFAREPQRVCASLDMDPDFKVDRHASGLLDFGPGTATFYCSTQSAPSQAVKIVGTEATLTVENPFYRRDTPSRLFMRKDNVDSEIQIADVNHYEEQINAFSLAALKGTPTPTPLADALANMAVIDAVFAADQQSTWVNVTTD